MSNETQTTRDILLVRPAHFGPNFQTATSNAFQRADRRPGDELAAAALQEFDSFADALLKAGVRALVFEDSDAPLKPDAIFPNNWLTTHANGDIYLYPLEAPSRRPERRSDIVAALSGTHGFVVEQVIDWSVQEVQGRYLEGTGSLVLDRSNRVAFAARSSRTHEALVKRFAKQAGYKVCAFDTADVEGRPIYHTNVMCALGGSFAIICAAAIPGTRRRNQVLARIEQTGRRIIEVSYAQMESFAANVVEVCGADDEPLILLSAAARQSFEPRQIKALEKHGSLLAVDVGTIERVGGGGVRCMVAENFLPVAKQD